MNERIKPNALKHFQEAGFTNDLIFKQVLRNYPDILRDVLKLCVPDIDASSFTTAESEHEIIVDVENKRIHLDLLTKTPNDETVCCLYHQKKDFISVSYSRKIPNFEKEYFNLLQF